MKHWPTPRSEDCEQTGAHAGTPDTLTSAARWATPNARDWKGQDMPQRRGGASLPHQVTTGQMSHASAGPHDPDSPSTTGKPRDSWQTPTVTDGEGRPYTYPNGNHDKPFLTLLGQAQPAGTNHRKVVAHLNPDWVEQLQGLPDSWTDLDDATVSRLLATRTRGWSRT
jgi:hypothetical protein